MESRLSTAPRYLLTVAGCTAALVAGGMSWVTAQQPPQAPAGQAQQGRGGGGGDAATPGRRSSPPLTPTRTAPSRGTR